MTREELDGLKAPMLLLGLCVAVGLLGGGWLLGHEIKTMKFADRSVDVKGLVERRVKSDHATWAIGFKTAGDDLTATFAHSEADKDAVLKFLAAQGVVPAEITTGDISVTDRQTNESGTQKGSRYVLEQSVAVVTTDVDKLARAGQQTASLVQAGVVLTGNSHIAYTFDGLNALKPDMITEATRNARAAADRFAADSGSQVGVIKEASQGTLSITADSPGSADDDTPMYGSNQSADSSIMKKVRVVVTITYYLK
jgi:hypothetical protein